MPVTKDEEVYALAEPQHGYFTSAQAKAAGLIQNTLTKMAHRGVIERVSRGVYRIVNYPVSHLSQYMEAVLWPQGGTHGVISHQSALAFHGLSDVSPAKIHVTLSPEYRVRRHTPSYLMIHSARLEERDVQVLNGIPVTTPVRSILDCHAARIARAHVRQAIEDGRANGKLLAREVAQLEAHLRDDASSSSSSSSSSASSPPSAPSTSPPSSNTPS